MAFLSPNTASIPSSERKRITMVATLAGKAMLVKAMAVSTAKQKSKIAAVPSGTRIYVVKSRRRERASVCIYSVSEWDINGKETNSRYG